MILSGEEAFKIIKRLEQVPYKPLTQRELHDYSQITVLDLSYTHITTLPDTIGQLANLQYLYLRYTHITTLPDTIGQLANLQSLDLSYTQITTLPDTIGQLANLRYLYLSYTRITTLPDTIGQLANLQSLSLFDTHITTLPDTIGQLANLQSLDLRYTHITTLPESLLDCNLSFVLEQYFSSLIDTGINLYNTDITSPPLDLLRQNDRDKIREWYKANNVSDEEKRLLNEGKIIFLGDGSAGKTHSIKRIMNGGIDNNINTPVTHGIIIEKWTPQSSNSLFHIWDFGGQHIMHSMHRCFLTKNCLYVVVLRSRSDSQFSSLTQQAKYWLSNINSFAHNSKVLIAINREYDDNGSGLNIGVNMEQLRNDFADKLTIYDAVTYCAKCCRNDNFDHFMQTISNYAQKLEITERLLPAPWFNVRNHLDKLNSYHNPEKSDSKPYLSEVDYQNICIKYKVTDTQQQRLLLTLLNELGVCFSYHELENYGRVQLKNYQVLNPEWLTNAIYAIITSGQSDNSGTGENQYSSVHGQIRHKQVLKLLNDKQICKTSKKIITYKDFEVKYILEVMRKFQLSYCMDANGNADTEFIPMLLPSDCAKDFRPKNNEYKKTLFYKIKYGKDENGFLPDTVVHRLMIQCAKTLNLSKCYRQGLRIDDNISGLIAIADMRTSLNTLHIEIYDTKGTTPMWEMLKELRQKIFEINEQHKLNDTDEFIRVEEIAEVSLPYLLDLKKNGFRTFTEKTFNKKAISLNVDEVLGIAYGVENIPKIEQMMRNSDKYVTNYENCSITFNNSNNSNSNNNNRNSNNNNSNNSSTKTDEPDSLTDTMDKVNTTHDFIQNIADWIKWFVILFVITIVIILVIVGVIDWESILDYLEKLA